jgi:hypothetical protein
MSILKKEKHISTLKLCPQFNGEGAEFVFGQKQILVGSAPNCDLVLPKEYAHHYHALITLGEHGMAEIVDFEGHLGVYINGQRVKKGTFGNGDLLKIGNYDFLTQEFISTDSIADQDEHLADKVADLPPVVPVDTVGQGKYTLVDGEACYIDFADEEFVINNLHPSKRLEDLDVGDFVYDIDAETPDVIRKQKDNRSLEVMTMANGFILSIDYIDLKDGEYFLTGGSSKKNKIHFDLFGEKQEAPFFRVEGGEFVPKELDGFEREMTDGQNLHTQNDFVYHYYKSPVQIFIRPTKTPPTLKPESLLDRDKGFWKEQGKIFGGGMILALLLLLINTQEEVPPPLKTLAVVYKTLPKEKMLEKQTAQLKQENQKNEEYKKVKTQKAKGNPAPAPKKVAKSKPQKTEKAPQKTKTKAVAKVDSYKNPFKTNLTNLLAKSGAVSDSTSKSVSTSTLSESSVTSDSNAKGKRKVANFKGKVGDLGKHDNINSNFSSGAKGLVDKRGIVTASASTKTVVLGAMDPEILRKILEEYIPQFRHCYQQELEFNSEQLKGVVDLQFTINKSGKAMKIKVLAKRANFSDRGTNCMAGVLKIIDFPKPKGGGIVDVRQPLNFFSEKG